MMRQLGRDIAAGLAVGCLMGGVIVLIAFAAWQWLHGE